MAGYIHSGFQSIPSRCPKYFLHVQRQPPSRCHIYTLASHCRLEHLRCKFTQESCSIGLWKIQENLIDTLALGIANGSQLVACHCACQRTREVAHDESQSTSTDSPDHRPEPRRGASSSVTTCAVFLGQSLFAQHFFEHGPELTSVTLITTPESKA